MARKRKNAGRSQNIIDDQSQDDNRMVMDTYTADLPSNVMHQILSLVSTKHAARASILSKEWRNIWSSVPVLDFDEDEGGKPCSDRCKLQRRNFINFMARCLKRRAKDKSNIDKFRLRMRYYGGLSSVNKWLTLAVERNVKEIELSFIRPKKSGVRSYRPFYIPQPILNNAKSLTTLKLQGVTVKDNIDPIRLPSLKTMSLILVQFRSLASFMHLISGCHSLEHLVLTSCTGLSDLKISSLSLKSLEVLDCDEQGIKVEAMNLESLRFLGNVFCRYMSHNFDIFSCQRVRSIRLCDIFLTKAWCNSFSSSFPLLENLALDQCHWDYFEHIEISSKNLKRFSFSDTEPIKPLFFLNLPNLSEARIELRYRLVESAVYSSQSSVNFRCLINCLGNFNGSEEVILHIVTLPELCTFPLGVRNTCLPPLPSLKHLEVELSASSTAETHDRLMDSLRWMAPVAQVSIHNTQMS